MLSAAAVTAASATPLPNTHSVTGSGGTIHSLHNGTIGGPNNSGFSDSDAAASSPREFSSDQTASDEGSADEASYERSEEPATRQADGVVALGQFQPLKGPTNKTEDVPPLGSNSQQPVTMKPTADQWNLMKVRVGFDVTRKGERSLVIDGYKFTKSRDGMSDRVFWRCSRRECKATAVTVSDRVEHVRTLHTHKPPLAGEFFVESAGGAKLQTVRFNYAPSSTKPRARRRVNSQQPLPQNPTQLTKVNRNETDSAGLNGDTTVTSPVSLANMMTTTTTASVVNNCVSSAGSHEQKRNRSAEGDGDSTNLQAQAVAAILSSLMERRAAAYRKDTNCAAGRHFHKSLEATEYRDSPPNQQVESCSKLGARQYAVSSLSCLLGMHDRGAPVSSHLSPQNLSPPVYVQASRDTPLRHSYNHYHSLGQCDSVSLQQQQAKRDSQNSTPDPPFEVSMHSPPPPLPPPTGYPAVVPISPPLSTESPDRAHLSYHDLLSRGTTADGTPTTKLTDLASLASSIHPGLASSECPSKGTGLANGKPQVHTTLPASVSTGQTTTVNFGSAVGLLGKAVLGQLVFLSGEQLKELSTASSSSTG
uniref:C2H2-type domain-containing protein n=1 Tax=Schistocephalus solidus TaxID=70667 RepID=A0A0X3Q5R0_SCHSO